MNKGFSYYFRNGMSISLNSLKGESFAKRFSLLVYFLMSFIGKLFFFTRPIFMIADTNLACMMKECQSFSLAKVFQNTCDGKRYKNLLFFSFLFDFAVICLATIVFIPTIILFSVYMSVGNYVDYYTLVTLFYLLMLMIVISSVVTGIVLISLLLTYAPVGYIGASTRKCDISDYLYNAKKGMSGVKWTTFLVNLVYSLIILAILALVCGSVACLLFYTPYVVGMVCSLIIILTFVIFFIYFIQIFLIGALNSNYLIFKYSVPLDKVIVASNIIEEEDKLNLILDEESEPDEDGNIDNLIEETKIEQETQGEENPESTDSNNEE